SSAALLSGGLGIMLSRRHGMTLPTKVMIGAWIIVLGTAASVDRRLLGATLTGAFLVQGIPAVAMAYRTPHPTRLARGTSLLILGELSCWMVFGAAQHDGPLIGLGTTGLISALLMLNRTRSTRGRQPLTSIPKRSRGSLLADGTQPCSDEAA